MKQLLIAAIALVALAGIASAQELTVQTLPNPIKNAKVGASATYDYRLSSPYRTTVGVLHMKLKTVTAKEYAVEEKISLGQGLTRGWTTVTQKYSLNALFLAHVRAQYAPRFPGLTIVKTKLTHNVTVTVGKNKHVCKRVFIDFKAVNQGRKVKGDLIYDLCPGVGPLGIVTFHSIVTYETSPGRFNLRQTLEMRLRAASTPK